MNMSDTLKYRPDIDGLRAIAVLMVVVFHAGINPFDGGFVGVDVFFVISGFLITSLVAKDLRAGTFSLLNFWERRIRRILPALTAVVAATLAAGAVFFLPDDFVGLARQTIWQAFTASNFYFYAHRGYFNTEHELEPLLHTWSLAVEEQFYFLFPVLMLLGWKFFRRRLMLCLWVICLLSFIASMVMVRFIPDQAFFLLPYRAWELLTGGLLALNLPHGKAYAKKAVEGAAASGIAMILAAGIFYDSKTDFPGLAAALPCIGTAWVIWSGSVRTTYISRMLSAKPLVIVGLVSYSWYLWHWPVFSFAEYVLQNEFKKSEKILCIFISFLLAYLSWKFIERPFRRPGGVLKTRRAVFFAALIALTSMVAGGFGIKTKNGFPDRFPEDAYAYAQGALDKNPLRKACDLKKFERIAEDDICEANPDSGKKPVFILWGDSQADAIAPAFIALSKKHDVNGYLAFKHSCPPILDIRDRQGDRMEPFCADYNRAHFDFIKRNKIKYVFMVSTWSNWARNKDLYFDRKDWYPAYEGRYDNIVMAGLQRTVDELQKIGVTVYFLIDGPTLRFEPPRMLALESVMGVKDSKAYASLDSYIKKRGKDVDNFVKQNKATGLVIADMLPLLCGSGKCISGLNGRSLYYDHNHFSAYGANYLAPVFEPFFENISR